MLGHSIPAIIASKRVQVASGEGLANGRTQLIRTGPDNCSFNAHLF